MFVSTEPPDRVSISFGNHSGPVIVGDQYTLQCEVHNVAPAKNLSVTFYKGQTPLGPPVLQNNPQKTPVTEAFSVVMVPKEEDNGAQYWCEAELDLGSAGPQPPPVVKSPRIMATVGSNGVALISSLNICFTLLLMLLL